MITQLIFAFVVVALHFGLNTTDPVKAQSYPTQPIRIVVSASPGGPNDFAARLVSHILSIFGQPTVVENRAIAAKPGQIVI
jgi:tripartite-type tricarboxylate transporter receptor subunit TctC